MKEIIERLWKGLEENKEHWDLMLVLADALEEAGLPGSKALRWMVKEQRRPDCMSSYRSSSNWYCTEYRNRQTYPDPKSIIPDKIWEALPPVSLGKVAFLKAFPSWREAVEALFPQFERGE